MNEMRLYAMTFGELELDKGWLFVGAMGKTVRIPQPFYLITHPKGNVLVDTGPHKDVVTDAKGRWGGTAEAFIPHCKAGDDVVSQLDKLGFKPKDIRYVVSTHLHLDHAGGNEFFPDSTFLIQKDELRFAYWPDPYYRGGYFRADFDHPLNYCELEGDYDIYGDGKIVLLRTIGHTPGHQSVVVRLPKSGTIVITADACFLKDSYENELFGALVWRSDEVVKSIRRFKDLKEKENATIFFGHDPDEWKKIKHAPEYYD